MQLAVKLIRKSGQRYSSRPAPTFRAPWFTTYTTASLAGFLMMMLAAGQFIFLGDVFLHRILGVVGINHRPRIAVAAGPQAVAIQQGAERPVDNLAQAGGSAGARDIDQVIADLRSRDIHKWRVAAYLLSDRAVVPERRTEVCEPLRDMAGSADDDDRREALIGLGRWGTDADVTTLIAELASPRAPVREGAAEGLALSKNPRAVDALVKLLRDPDQRSNVANRLRRIGPEAERALAQLLDEPDEAVALGAALILERGGTRDSLSALQAALDRPRPAPGPPPADPFGPEARKVRDERKLHDTLDRAIRNAATRESARRSSM